MGAAWKLANLMPPVQVGCFDLAAPGPEVGVAHIVGDDQEDVLSPGRLSTRSHAHDEHRAHECA